MPAPKSYQFDTLSLHAGQQPDPQYRARAQPIYFTTSYVFKDTDQAASLFNMERGGHVYTRISNPTNAVLEERVSALEGGVGAIATASGQAAMHLAIATLMGAGSHIVASRSLYGGSHNLLHYTLPRFGIDTTFVDPSDVDAFRNAIRPNTRLLFGERTPLRVDQDRGIILHMAARTGTVTPYWVDLTVGWEAVQLALQVRDIRKRKHILTPFEEIEIADAIKVLTEVGLNPTPVADPILDAIDDAWTVEALGHIWKTNKLMWTPVHTDAAALRKQAIVEHDSPACDLSAEGLCEICLAN
jgi:hypothetical protein